MAVDREFMYKGSAGPGPGGRTEGRTEGGRADRRKGRFERQYNDVHRCSLKTQSNYSVFDCSNPAKAQVSILAPTMKQNGSCLLGPTCPV